MCNDNNTAANFAFARIIFHGGGAHFGFTVCTAAGSRDVGATHAAGSPTFLCCAPGGGHWNHSFFWKAMGAPSNTNGAGADLKASIDTVFGSMDDMKTKFNQAAAGRFGSGTFVSDHVEVKHTTRAFFACPASLHACTLASVPLPSQPKLQLAYTVHGSRAVSSPRGTSCISKRLKPTRRHFWALSSRLLHAGPPSPSHMYSRPSFLAKMCIFLAFIGLHPAFIRDTLGSYGLHSVTI